MLVGTAHRNCEMFIKKLLIGKILLLILNPVDKNRRSNGSAMRDHKLLNDKDEG